MSDAVQGDGQATNGAGTVQQGAEGVGQGTGTPSPAPQPSADQGAGQQGQGQGNQDAGKQGEGEFNFDLKLPNGVELDEASASEFKSIVNDKALTPNQRAQKIVDLAVKREQGRVDAHLARVNEWAESVRTDKELGGEKLEETLSVAKKAVDLGPPELKEFLNASGLGNHPSVVRWAYNVGKALSEDRFVAGSGGNAPHGSMADRLYGSTSKA